MPIKVYDALDVLSVGILRINKVNFQFDNNSVRKANLFHLF